MVVIKIIISFASSLNIITMTNKANNTQNNASKQLSQKYDTNYPTDLKSAVRSILLQQKKEIMEKV